MIESKENVSGQMNVSENLSGSVEESKIQSGNVSQSGSITGNIKTNTFVSSEIFNPQSMSGIINKEQPNIGGKIGSPLIKVKDIKINGESIVDENGIANIDKTDTNDSLYSSDDIDKDTWYSFSGAKTLDGIKIQTSETDFIGIIEGIYLLLDYDLDDFVNDYPYAKDSILNMTIPYEIYISDLESKHITIDLFNRGKCILEIVNTNDKLSCSKLIVINYLKGWAVECDENLTVLFSTEKTEESDPTVPGHVKRITINDIQKWNNKSDFSGNYKDLTNQPVIPTNTSQLNNDSNFITKSVSDLDNFYNKEEINKLAGELVSVNDVLVDGTSVVDDSGKANISIPKVDLTGYATEDWVEDQEYMPIPDFHDYMNVLHYTKTQTDELLADKVDKETGKGLSTNDYTDSEKQNVADNTDNRHNHANKEVLDNISQEDINKWNDNKGTEYKATDNIVIEDDTLKVVTNTGYEVSDKDIQLQPINASGTTGTNKMVYTDDEIEIIYDGSNKIRRAKNGIIFDVIELPCNCVYLAYSSDYKRLWGTDSVANFIYSDDNGLTWTTISNSKASGITGLDIGYGAGFRSRYRSTKDIISWTFNATTGTLSQNSRIASTIIPEFIAMINNTQFIWCNSTGTFKYGAGSQEGNFASLSGITVNLLKRVNNITFLGLKNNNKIYLLEPASMITQYKWIEYTLPNVCTVNDIIFNSYDKTYYIFTDINTYYKTKDFINFDSWDRNGFRGIQGYFTLMGIQMTTSEKNYLLLAPTRTTLEDKLQEHDRALNKELWAGNGLGVDGEQIYVKGSSYIIANSNGVMLKLIDEWIISQDIVEKFYVAVAEEKGLFDPYEVENWFYSDEAYPEENYKAVKFIFNQAGSFYDQVLWETEYQVEKYEYGYLFYDQNMSIFKYVKLGNLGWILNNIFN